MLNGKSSSRLYKLNHLTGGTKNNCLTSNKFNHTSVMQPSPT